MVDQSGKIMTNSENWVPILEKCYKNDNVAQRLSTFHAMKSYPCYSNWYS